MTNNVVSVRIPKTLDEELNRYAQKNHFMDVSEVVRTILRKKAMEKRDPYSYQIRSFKKDIIKRINKLSHKQKQSEVLTELDKIKNDILKKVGDSK